MYGLKERPRPTAVRNGNTRRLAAVIPAAFQEGFDAPDYDAPPPSLRGLPGKPYDDTHGNGQQRKGGISARGQNLRSLCESHGVEWAARKLGACLKSGELRSTDFSIKELAEAFCGPEWVRTLDPRRLGGFQNPAGWRSLLEAGEGVDVSAFQDITGQIFFNRIKDGWENAQLVGEKLTDKFPTQLDGERVPWLGHIIDEGEPIHPGTEYPMTSFGERYVDTPRTQKWGMTCWLTKEMVFFDRTGQALKAAGEVGWKLGYNKEKRILTVALGQVNSYKLNGTAYNTYLTAPQSVPAYVNAQGSTPLIDYTSVQTALTLASQILDPDTRNPLDGIEFKQLFVMPANLFHARRLVAATEYWNTQPGFAAATTPPEGNVQMHSINPVGQLEVLTSPIAYQLFTNVTTYNPQWTALTSTQTNAYWWIGQFMRSFWYMENWPFTVVQAPPNNPREFDQDLVVGWKVSERGVPAIQDPRYTFQFWNTEGAFVADKKLSDDDRKALEAAKALIMRLEGPPPAPEPSMAPPVLRRFRVNLDGVTWVEKTKEYLPCTTRAMVHDPKSGRSKEVIIDRAVVEAFNEADAWEKFRKSWGIRHSDHTPQYAEVRTLTEDERKAPPANVVEPNPNVLVGVPPPTVLPIRADGEFNRPVQAPNAAVG